MADYTKEEVDQVLRNVKSQMQDSSGAAGSLVSPLSDQKVLYSNAGKISDMTISKSILDGLFNGSGVANIYTSNLCLNYNSNYLIHKWNGNDEHTSSATVSWSVHSSNKYLDFTGAISDFEFNQSLATTDDVTFDEITAGVVGCTSAEISGAIGCGSIGITGNCTVDGTILGGNGATNDLYLGDRTISAATTNLEGGNIIIYGDNYIDISCGTSANGEVRIGNADTIEPVIIKGVVSHSGTMGFYGTTPAVQPSAVADADTGTIVAQFNALLAGLRSNGTIAT